MSSRSIQMSAVETNVNGKATLAVTSKGGGMGADNTADQENVQVWIAAVWVKACKSSLCPCFWFEFGGLLSKNCEENRVFLRRVDGRA